MRARFKRFSDDWEAEGMRASRRRNRKCWLRREKLAPWAPCRWLRLLRWPDLHLLRRPFLPNAQYIDTGFPSGNVFVARAVKSFAPEKSSGPNQRQKYPTRATGCRRRGNAPRPCALKKQNNGPYSTSVQAGSKGVNSTEGLPCGNVLKMAKTRGPLDGQTQPIRVISLTSIKRERAAARLLQSVGLQIALSRHVVLQVGVPKCQGGGVYVFRGRAR
jgi:hypothetical protein